MRTLCLALGLLVGAALAAAAAEHQPHANANNPAVTGAGNANAGLGVPAPMAAPKLTGPVPGPSNSPSIQVGGPHGPVQSGTSITPQLEMHNHGIDPAHHDHGQPQHLEVNPNVHASGHIGERDFDSNGIGRPDFEHHQHDHDDHWRYSRYGNTWFYWGPQNSWLYFVNGAWVTYNPATYMGPTTTFVSPAPALTYGIPQALTSPVGGPYYEDQQGFYTDNNGQHVYDLSIKRVGN